MGKITEAVFYDLKIASVQLYGSLVQINAHVNNGQRFVPCFKFVYRGCFAAKMASMFKVGHLVNIRACPVAYRGRVYGKRGKPIHYPDGRVRMTTKTRFFILKIGPLTKEV